MARPAAANEDCAQKFDQFAAEMDRIANAYDKMKTQSEICAFLKSKDIPTHRNILAWVEANYTKCKTGTKALQFARSTLQRSVSREKEQCH
jgi:uncharacterized protein YbcI